MRKDASSACPCPGAPSRTRQPNARSVRQPEPAAFELPMGHFQPLASPDPLHPLVVDYPARYLSGSNSANNSEKQWNCIVI